MIIISHRGNIEGPVPSEENKPEYIKRALSLGFNVEVDLWVIDGKFMLGHDKPLYDIRYAFLFTGGLWIHCKNIDALYMLLDTTIPYYFFHQKDDVTVTSNGYIWTYPGKKLTSRSIAVVTGKSFVGIEKAYGVCTDYPLIFKSYGQNT
jgi:hypothetical protein